jgi:hypothetical protein
MIAAFFLQGGSGIRGIHTYTPVATRGKKPKVMGQMGATRGQKPEVTGHMRVHTCLCFTGARNNNPVM